MSERPQFDEWQGKDGKWHDGLNRTFERKRDMLQAHAEGCGCGQCQRRYENYMLRIQEDRNLTTQAFMFLNWLIWTENGYSQDELEFFDNGDVLPIKKKLPRPQESLGDPDE